jgi:hypothetical protein
MHTTDSQIPFILAWALSIHKAKGQTLERVKMNQSRAFEKEQVYVAMSRAAMTAGLQVRGFDASKARAHEQVHRFYNGFSRLEAFRQATALISMQATACAASRRQREPETLNEAFLQEYSQHQMAGLHEVKRRTFNKRCALTTVASCSSGSNSGNCCRYTLGYGGGTDSEGTAPRPPHRFWQVPFTRIDLPRNDGFRLSGFRLPTGPGRHARMRVAWCCQ